MKVIVIGAGAAGLAIGWRLRQAGAEVAVIERGQPGRGATWAAAGMIAAPPERPSDAEAEFARRAALEWPAFAAELEEASGRGISYQTNGGLAVALTDEERTLLSQREGETLSPADARKREPRLAPEIAGALWIEKEAKVDNRALGPALAIAFLKAGGSLLFNETVVRFELRDSAILGVRTPFSVHQADAYVLAAGAWTSRIEGLPPGVLPPVVPVKGEMLALQPPPGEQLPGPGILGNEIYMVAQRGTLLVGATVERVGFDSSLTGRGCEWLLGRAVTLMPALREWPVTEHWAGLRPGSPDDLPILGRSALDGLFIASGQFRSGILYTPAIADSLGALVLGKNASFDVAAFDPSRFRAK